MNFIQGKPKEIAELFAELQNQPKTEKTSKQEMQDEKSIESNQNCPVTSDERRKNVEFSTVYIPQTKSTKDDNSPNTKSIPCSR